MTHFVSTTCGGEECTICGNDATHKIGEEISHTDPSKGHRHNFTAYVCCGHFLELFGDAVFCDKPVFQKVTIDEMVGLLK